MRKAAGHSPKNANPGSKVNEVLRELLQQFEARRLNRDAVTVIDNDTHTLKEEHLSTIADQLEEHLQLVRDATAIQEPTAKTRERLKAFHRDARTRRDPIGLSAATLAIIRLRADELGVPAQPACATIDAFVEKWARHT